MRPIKAALVEVILRRINYIAHCDGYIAHCDGAALH
jgi:hypothetical protein